MRLPACSPIEAALNSFPEGELSQISTHLYKQYLCFKEDLKTYLFLFVFKLSMLRASCVLEKAQDYLLLIWIRSRHHHQSNVDLNSVDDADVINAFHCLKFCISNYFVF